MSWEMGCSVGLAEFQIQKERFDGSDIGPCCVPGCFRWILHDFVYNAMHDSIRYKYMQW